MFKFKKLLEFNAGLLILMTFRELFFHHVLEGNKVENGTIIIFLLGEKPKIPVLSGAEVRFLNF